MCINSFFKLTRHALLKFRMNHLKSVYKKKCLRRSKVRRKLGLRISKWYKNIECEHVTQICIKCQKECDKKSNQALPVCIDTKVSFLHEVWKNLSLDPFNSKFVIVSGASSKNQIFSSQIWCLYKNTSTISMLE